MRLGADYFLLTLIFAWIRQKKKWIVIFYFGVVVGWG